MKNMLQQAVTSLLKFAKKWAKPTAYLYTLIFLFSTMLLSGCDKKPSVILSEKPSCTKSPQTLSRAIYSAYLQLDPQFIKAIADAAPVRDLLTGLMQFDKQGDIVPAIATSLTSKDGKTWIIQLDEKAQWSNEEPVTASDFVASWQRLSDPNNHSPLAPYLIYMGINNAKAIIQHKLPITELGVTAISPKTLKIELSQPNFQLPKMLAHLALLPTFKGEKPQENQTFISNGAYKIIARGKLNLKLQAISPTQAFQTVEYHLINTAQNPDCFDIIENPLENYHHHNVKLPRLCTYFYEFNFKDKALNKKEIRQAISSMLSSTDISRDLGIATYSALPATMGDKPRRHLPALATEQLFRKIGIDSNTPLNLTVTYDNQGKNEYIAKRIARTLGQSDLFRIHLQAVNWQQLLTKRTKNDFQFIRSGWCADYDDPALFVMPFHSASPNNKSGYANSRVDTLLEQLQGKNLDKTTRHKLILDIVNILQDDVAILPLFQYQRRIAIDPDIQGVTISNDSEVIYSKDLSRQ
ncbi:peptide/nickel transport system substrate-binding protein [Vespertiliibacter pulmonis]|uniref:Peptide/nickel transport system substrate-binding protein n=1 Tax=Vespertiliibacter pulmonis TaxID=1443036 RepID=A0A3N4VTA8_9PAST|nr:peptide ABC transporter substrate-binding protein [Vespertiliibacter pulmonis]RPE86326.1 peptide/nickel transport system substrate-binding protein [Vespertiliibacter pulmonis]